MGLETEGKKVMLQAFGTNAVKVDLQVKTVQELTDNLRLRADIDYLAIMSEVEYGNSRL